MLTIKKILPKSGPNLKVTPTAIDLIRAGRWDVACCANNHIGDFGHAATMETLEMLAHNGIAHVGAGKNLDVASQPLIIEKKGINVALLAVAENEFGMAGKTTAGANPLKPLRNIAHIKMAGLNADFVVVMIHGGNEFNPIPSPRMIELCRAFVDAGAAAVIAGHTHCPQGIEFYHGAPIIYSLGNLLFDSPDGEYSGYNWWYGYMVKIGFTKKHAINMEIIPHHCRDGKSVTLLRNQERIDFLKYVDFISRVIMVDDAPEKYFDAWCMMELGGYFSVLGSPFAPIDWNNPKSIDGLMAMRNLHTCEAHNELVTTTLRILTERCETEATAFIPFLKTLREGRIPV